MIKYTTKTQDADAYQEEMKNTIQYTKKIHFAQRMHLSEISFWRTQVNNYKTDT